MVSTLRLSATAAATRAASAATATARPVLLRVLAPELVDELAGDQIAAIERHEAHDQAAVLLQVAEDEVLAYELAQIGVVLHELDAILDVLVAHVGEEAAHDPGDQIV